jgi:hypothetical protein
MFEVDGEIIFDKLAYTLARGWELIGKAAKRL